MGRYTMRKITLLFCVLLLVPTLALANSDMVSISELRQQVEAMGRWTKTYEAYGRTIEVDVPIIVPEVEKVPILSAVPVLPYQNWTETGRLMKKGCLDAFAIYEDEDMMGVLNEGNVGKRVEVIITEDEQDERRMWFSVGCNEPRFNWTQKVECKTSTRYPIDLDFEKTYAGINTYSLEFASILG